MPSQNDPNDQPYYNNPDSFAMVFDDAWKSYASNLPNNIDEKLMITLSKIKDHPFIKENPNKANQIARFRLKLLGLK